MKTKENQNIYLRAQRFADVTKLCIKSGNIQRAKRCMQVADEVFSQGSKEIQNAITNVYVYSLSTFMEMHRCSIKAFFPKNLQIEYYKQVNTTSV